MTTATVPPSRKVLVDCVLAATAAPSLHNSQPWRFRIDGPAVEVYADSRRRLEVADPAGRELMISVGAAVCTLRLAIRQAGYRCDLTPFPRPDEPDLVARVIAGRPAPVTAATEALAAAIPHRHTNRRPFAHTPVPPAVLTATWQNLATTPISQPIEVPAVRRMLTDPATGVDAQMVLRVGYGKMAGRSPRRPISEVLLPDRAQPLPEEARDA